MKNAIGQAEAASLLAAGTVQSVEQYQQERQEEILANLSPLSDAPPEDTRTEAEKEREKIESLNGLVREFSNFIGQFLDRMKMYQTYVDAFAEMSQPQISFLQRRPSDRLNPTGPGVTPGPVPAYSDSGKTLLSSMRQSSSTLTFAISSLP